MGKTNLDGVDLYELFGLTINASLNEVSKH